MSTKPFVFLFFAVVSALTIKGFYHTITSRAPDFSIFWLSSRDLYDDSNPYLNPKLFTANPNPPHAHIFFLPLTLLPYQIAQGIFTILSTAAMAASVWLSLKLTKEKFSLNLYLTLLSFTFISFPTKFTLGMGQTNSIVLLILLTSFYSYKKKKKMFPGVLLGLASSLKTTFLFFFLFFLVKKEGRIVFWGICTYVIIILTTMLVSNPYLYEYWITKSIAPFLGLQGREVYYNQGISGIVSRFTNNISLRNYFTTTLSILTVGIAVRTILRKGNEGLQLSLLIISLLLIDSLSWQHHFIWLVFPFTIMVFHLTRQKRIALLVSTLSAYALISWNVKNPGAVIGMMRPIILSHVFIGTLILFVTNYMLLKEVKMTPKK